MENVLKMLLRSCEKILKQIQKIFFEKQQSMYYEYKKRNNFNEIKIK